ncbi:uncharacterized protein [Typha latifolia]|uniref:uncharacterized protein isoform X1 n=1 Tax=Typha latifolia TaxID=4733 RepID=UPI003C2D5542
MTNRNKSMEIDLSDGSNSNVPSLNEEGLVGTPVAAGASGEGLPYAPVDWPCPGDIWGWKVGNRQTASGHWADRYLYPPSHLHKLIGTKSTFQSKSSVEDFLRKEFPEMDADSFFASFIWKVPCKGHNPRKGAAKDVHIDSSRKDVSENSKCESTVGAGGCKARNKMCPLQDETRTDPLAVNDCDICCAEAGFCRVCCCILCSKTVDLAYGGYNFVRCEATVDENYFCGHVAHTECALRSYMAGTVGGSIGLDVEYYCRCCDSKTDLMPHVTKLARTCESLDSREGIEQILSMCLCILRGSEQMEAKSLHNRIESVMAKLKHGVHLDEIWKVEDNISVPIAGEMPYQPSEVRVLGAQRVSQTVDCTNMVKPMQKHEMMDGNINWPVYITSDHRNVSIKLEDEVDQVLQELKKSQESEYRIAEQKLYSHKDFLLSLYHLLDTERSQLAHPLSLSSGGNYDALLSNVLNRVDQIKHEEEKFRSMMKIASGFARTPRHILREHFGMIIDD